MILALLRLWMNSKVPPMNMDPPHPCQTTYYDFLINACVRYDRTKKANIGKRRNVYNTNIDSTYVDYPTDVIDYVPDSPHGGIDLPPDAFYQIHALSSRPPPSPRPGNPSRPNRKCTKTLSKAPCLVVLNMYLTLHLLLL